MLTSIEWASHSWNPLKARQREDMKLHMKGGMKVIPAGKVGYHCEHVSPGCLNCYAEAMNKRTLPAWGTGSAFNVPNRDRVEIFLDEEVLLAPIKWKIPARIFVCSMTDLFAEFVSEEMIEKVFAVMALCPQHTFLCLTKRAQRMYEWMHGIAEAPGEGMRDACIEGQAQAIYASMHPGEDPSMWLAVHQPLPNVHLGVSCENQEWADKRVPFLLRCPAAVRWLSIEPQIGDVDLVTEAWSINQGGIGWIVQGGESGRGARPFNIQWAREAVHQCRVAGVPIFVKQIGANPVLYGPAAAADLEYLDPCFRTDASGRTVYRIATTDRKGGTMEHWPPDVRVREYPR